MSALPDTCLAKVGTPVSCIKGNAKLSGVVRENIRGNLTIEWIEGITICYTPHQIMAMGITEGDSVKVAD